MFPHHVASHEIEALEQFICDTLPTLPKLQNAAIRDLPSVCSNYYILCSTMLREILAVLNLYSPRLARLISQLWDILSINYYVLLQQFQITLDKDDELHNNWKTYEQFCMTNLQQVQSQLDRLERENELLRLDNRELRVEKQLNHQQINRYNVELCQLENTLAKLLAFDDKNENHVLTMSSTARSTNEQNTIHPRDWDAFTIISSDEKIERIHPFDQSLEDFDEYFRGICDKHQEQVCLLNHIDRFINSNINALLWKHSSNGEQASQFMEKIMNSKTISTQTEEIEVKNDLQNDQVETYTLDCEIFDNTTRSSVLTLNGRRRAIIPLSLKAQITTLPKIRKILAKDQVTVLIFRLCLTKVDEDAIALRNQFPRVHIHRFMKEYFVKQFNIPELAEYRMMMLVKSCLYYYDKAECSNPKDPQGRNTSNSIAGTPVESLLEGVPDLRFVAPEDSRIALFTIFCELVHPVCPSTSFTSNSGNCISSMYNAYMDILGDFIELDSSIKTLNEALERPCKQWRCRFEYAEMICSQHLSFLNATELGQFKQQLQQLITSDPVSSNDTLSDAVVNDLPNTNLIYIDHCLVLFLTAWFKNDLQLEEKLHNGFQSQVKIHSQSPLHKHSLTYGPLSTDLLMEQFRSIWQNLPDVRLSVLDIQALERTIEDILQAKAQARQITLRGRRNATTNLNLIISDSPNSVAISQSADLQHIGNIKEKEFIFHVLQVLRCRRNTCHGIRTNGRSLFDTESNVHLGGCGKYLREEEHQIPISDLKPGLIHDSKAID